MADIFKCPQAELDLLEIWEFIAEDNLDRADEFLDILDDKLQMARNPGIGKRREELAPGLRSFVVRNYVFSTRKLKVDRFYVLELA